MPPNGSNASLSVQSSIASVDPISVMNTSPMATNGVHDSDPDTDEMNESTAAGDCETDSGQDNQPTAVYSMDQLHPGPTDVPDPQKWFPPPFVSPLPVEARPQWLHDECLPFLTQFDYRVNRSPNKDAVSWIEDNGHVSRTYTYLELQDKSYQVTSCLRSKWNAKEGDRVLLVYPPGLDFLIAFIGCLRAGVVAVPVYPPNPMDLRTDIPKLRKIVSDSGSKLVLTTRLYMRVLHASRFQFMTWPGYRWVTTSNLPVSTALWRPLQMVEKKAVQAEVDSSNDNIAFLQYTSGSTSDPKGVIVGRNSIAHNNMFVRRTLRIYSQSRFLSWLPQYHDMGLIVAYLTTLSAGASGFYLSPLSFIQRPAMWIQLLSKHRITHSATPNFGLELCVRKFSPERDVPPEGLNLSTVSCIVNGAEPVRVESMAKFNKTFAPYGWRPCAMCPSYGLAEMTVGATAWGSKMVSGPPRDGGEITEQQDGQAVTVHSSGNLAANPPEQGHARSIDPVTCEELPGGEVGEIWICSPSVALGYWHKEALTREMFHAKVVKGQPTSPYYSKDDISYLRTGDLGFILDHQLFITGRMKDLIILNGRNFYPQDLERTVEKADSAIRPGCVAALCFVGPTGQESVAIVAEVTSSKIGAARLVEVAMAIRRSVGAEHRISPTVVAIIPPRTIPKTTSGKIRRSETGKRLAALKLTILNTTTSGLGQGTKATKTSIDSSPNPLNPFASLLHCWQQMFGGPTAAPTNSIEAGVLDILGVPPGTKLRGSDTLASLGLTSLSSVEVAELIQDRTNKLIPLENMSAFTLGDIRKLKDAKTIPTPKDVASSYTQGVSGGGPKPLACILAFGTANPEQVHTQVAFARDYPNTVGMDADSRVRFNRICEVSGIETRHMAMEESFVDANPDIRIYGRPSLKARQDILGIEGPKLAHEACEKALKEWGGRIDAITHLIVVTVSGVHLPGCDLALTKSLGLQNDVGRVMLHMLGCYAGVTGLRIAKDLVENNPGARALFVCCELNSLIFQAPHESLPDSLVTAAIFGDGAAALVIGAGDLPFPKSPSSPRQNESSPIYEIVFARTTYVPESERHIAGDLTEAGLLVHLKKEVPLVLPQPVKEFSTRLLGIAGASFENSFWAVHPGGRAILDAIERKCQLGPEQLAPSREVLRRFGNMSSGSVLFVLDVMHQTKAKARAEGKVLGPQWGLALGFGPGVTVEGALLRML